MLCVVKVRSYAIYFKKIDWLARKVENRKDRRIRTVFKHFTPVCSHNFISHPCPTDVEIDVILTLLTVLPSPASNDAYLTKQ